MVPGYDSWPSLVWADSGNTKQWRPFGLTPQGLKIKRLADIIEDLQRDAQTTFGTAVDLDPRRPMGQFIGIQAERLSQVWELIQQVHNANSPRFAEGKQPVGRTLHDHSNRN